MLTAFGSESGSPWNAGAGGVDEDEGSGVEKVTEVLGMALGSNDIAGKLELELELQELERLRLELALVEREARLEGETLADREGVDDRGVDEREGVDERDDVNKRDALGEREELEAEVALGKREEENGDPLRIVLEDCKELDAERL